MKLQTAVRLAERDLGNLQVTHRHARSLEDFAVYRDNPRGFIHDVLKCTDPGLWWAQEQIADAMLGDQPVVVQSCAAAGKDYIAARLALWWIFSRRGLVVALGPTERQVREVLMRNEIRRAWSAAADLPGDLFEMALRVDGAGGLLAMVSKEVSRLTGYHYPNGVLVILTEAQGIEGHTWEAALANTAGERDKTLAVGNPLFREGRFYEVCQSSRWRVFKLSAFDHPNLVQGREVIPGAITQAFVDAAREEYGADSPFFVARVKGEFPTEGSIDSLFRLEWLEGAYERHEAGEGLDPNLDIVVALDVARSWHRDESVAAIAQGTRLHSLTAWRSRDLVDTAARFTLLADRTRLTLYAARHGKTVDETAALWSDPEKICEWCDASGAPGAVLIVDAPGIGSGVVDELRRRGRVCCEYWGWSPTAEGQRLANQRAAVYWHLRKLLESGRAELPRDPMMHSEMLAMQWQEDARGRIVMIAKDELRKSLGRSPDRLDAAVVALAESSDGWGPRPTVSFTHASF